MKNTAEKITSRFDDGTRIEDLIAAENPGTRHTSEGMTDDLSGRECFCASALGHSDDCEPWTCVQHPQTENNAPDPDPSGSVCCAAYRAALDEATPAANPGKTEIIEALRSAGHLVECPVTGRTRLNGTDVTAALEETQYDEFTLVEATDHLLRASGEDAV